MKNKHKITEDRESIKKDDSGSGGVWGTIRWW